MEFRRRTGDREWMHCNGAAVRFWFPSPRQTACSIMFDLWFYARPWFSSQQSGWTGNWGPSGWLVVGSCFDFDSCPGHSGKLYSESDVLRVASPILAGGNLWICVTGPPMESHCICASGPSQIGSGWLRMDPQAHSVTLSKFKSSSSRNYRGINQFF